MICALTTGTGPDHLYANPNRVVTFRLGRTFTTRNGVVNVGGSLLQGRLPITDLTTANPFAVELPPSGRVRMPTGAALSARAGSAAMLPTASGASWLAAKWSPARTATSVFSATTPRGTTASPSA